MNVLVIGMNGRGLMPTTPRKARVLMKELKAVVERRTPFTIRLLYKTGCAVQDVTLASDTGSQHIGISAVSGNKAVIRSEFALRPSMDKRVLNETRASYRRGRRYRKTRYRHPKYRPHTKRVYCEKPVKRNGHKTHCKKAAPPSFTSNRRKGWLPSSIQSKVDHHIRIISRYIEALPDRAKLRIEAARFDIARMENPAIHGELYQKGRMYDFENTKAYVFFRDNYTCRVCKKKAGSKREDGSVVKIVAHHIDYRSKAATDNPDRMACVCTRCHTAENHQEGGILYGWMISGKKIKRGRRDATFMNILGVRLMKAFPEAEFTYGNITSADRKAMGLAKTHANDAVAIASRGAPVTVLDETAYYQQVRSRKRSLHEANPRKGRKEPNRLAKRNAKNKKFLTVGEGENAKTFHVYDRVMLDDRKGWISGFTKAEAYVKDEHDAYITMPGRTSKPVNLSSLKIISHNNNWLTGALAPIGK